MNSLLIKTEKKLLTKSQAAFNRLIKKIEKIQVKIKETEAQLNQGLYYYQSHVRPVEEKMVEKLSTCIPIFYSYYKHPRSKLSKKEKEILKELIQSLLSRLANYMMPQEIGEEIKEIIKDIEGVNINEMIDIQLDSLKKDISGFAKQEGLNLDLSALNASDSKEELMAKLQQAMHEASEFKQTEEIDPPGKANEKVKKKTKQQLKKEQHEREIEEIQKKGLSKIYKQLARTLHPDLELDPQLKLEKEALMKKLTVAYENQDLHALLSLEIKWMNYTSLNENISCRQTAEEQLNIYNTLLKDQVKSLEEELDYLFMHPRYFDLRHILNDYHSNSILEILKDEEQQLTCDIERYSSSINDLNKGDNFKRVKQILKDFSSPPDFLELITLFL